MDGIHPPFKIREIQIPLWNKLVKERGYQPWPGEAGVWIIFSSGFSSSPRSLSVGGKVTQSTQNQAQQKGGSACPEQDAVALTD